MSFARIAYILPASETFGQLQISYGRMLQDVGKFIFIYFTVMIAFICGLTSLYSLSENDHFSSLVQTTGTLFWAAFGMGTSAAPQITDGGRHNMVELVGYILYGVYILGAVVVLINMLIAMMSNTFEEIQECEDIEWKFARAKLWISFIEEGTTLPIPFNIVPTPKSILKVFYYVKNGVFGCASYPAGGDDNEGGFEIDYKAIMHKVVLRYIHKMKFEKKGDSLKEDLLDSKEEILAQTYNMCSSLHQRLESIERYLLIHAHGNDHKDENTSSTVATSNTTTTTTVTAPSPNPVHIPLQATRSVPSHVTDMSSNGDGALSASYYEPRRDFGSRRWSYYHDRPRRQDRHKSQHDQTTSASKTLSTEGLPPQQQLQQPPHQQHQRNDHSPTRQQIREDNSFRRERVRNEYSPVRYEDKGGHSPVRLQETADHPLMSTWREEDSEIGMRRTGSRYDSRQQKTEQRTMPYGHSESTLRRQLSTRNPNRNSCSDDQPLHSPSSLNPNPSPQFLSKDDPIPLPDLTPTRTRTLKREFSRTERHFTQGGTRRNNRSPSLGDGGVECGRGGGGSGRGGRGSLTPRTSPTPNISQCQTSPVHSSPHSHETVLVSDRHARTQSLHRQQARTTFSSKGHVLTSQGSKEV